MEPFRIIKFVFSLYIYPEFYVIFILSKTVSYMAKFNNKSFLSSWKQFTWRIMFHYLEAVGKVQYVWNDDEEDNQRRLCQTFQTQYTFLLLFFLKMDEPTASAPTINCKSEFKIHNISIRNAPFLKDYYWNSMAITKFNKMLETANNYCCFRMTFPKVVRDYEPMTIVWHVKTVEEDSLPVEYSLKREKICECPMVPMQVGLNIFKKVYDCPHRKLIEMKPTAGVITGTGTDTIELNFQYNIEGSHCVVYLLTWV